MTYESEAAQPYIAALEQELAIMSSYVVRVRPRECVTCYVYRMVREFGCLGPRFLQEFQERAAPRATALLSRMARRGAYCDCELFLNAFELRAELMTPAELTYVPVPGGHLPILASDFPEVMPQCVGVRRGSTQPCANWVGIPRYYGT